MKKEKEKEKKKKKERRADAPAAVAEELVPAPARGLSDADALGEIVALVGGRWKIRILWALRDGEGHRYSSIKTTMPTITDMMLSQSLRDLCEHGLVSRRPFQEIPPRVEYVITPHGAQAIPAIQRMMDWVKGLPEGMSRGNNS